MRFSLSFAAIAALTAVLLSGCAATTTALQPASETAPASNPSSAAQQLTPAQFARAVEEPGRITVNVHVPFEGNIAGTDLSVPYDQINAQAARLPQDRSTPLAVYCRTGRMSKVAVTALSALGYTNIVELAGGMEAWTADNRPLSG